MELILFLLVLQDFGLYQNLQLYSNFLRFTFFTISGSIGFYYVSVWHFIILRFCCYFTVLHFHLFRIEFGISQLEMVMASELHNQIWIQATASYSAGGQCFVYFTEDNVKGISKTN